MAYISKQDMGISLKSPLFPVNHHNWHLLFRIAILYSETKAFIPISPKIEFYSHYSQNKILFPLLRKYNNNNNKRI